MEEYSEIVGKLIKRKRPSVPAGYFENLPKSFMSDLIAGQLETADDVSEEEFYSYPKDFFKNFGQSLKDEIEAEMVFENYGIRKSNKPSVPENFFGQSQFQIPKQKSNSRGRLLRITFWSGVSGIAATLLLLISLNLNWNESVEKPEIGQETTTNGASEEEAILDAYGDYLDEETIVDYIVENDLDVSSADDDETYFNYLEDDIEDIYLELD